MKNELNTLDYDTLDYIEFLISLHEEVATAMTKY